MAVAVAFGSIRMRIWWVNSVDVSRLTYELDPMGRRHWNGDRFTAAVCRRGHATSWAVERDASPAPDHCPECGARVLTDCPACGERIQGSLTRVAAPYAPPVFCACGSPFPWASEQAVIYHLENQLEEEPDLAESDRRELEAHLRILSNHDESAKKRATAYAFIEKTVPKVWAVAEPALRIFLTSEVQQHLPK